MRILALDWGTVRLGVAISDEQQKFAFPLDRPIKSQDAISEIAKLVKNLGVIKIVLGLPKTLSGREEKAAKKARNFAKLLAKTFSIPIELVDERFTSVAAEKLLLQHQFSQKKQRLIIDNIAAQILLQQYLDTNSAR